MKPGISKLVKERSAELKEEKLGCLNLLNFMQGRYTARLHSGDWEAMKELKLVQQEITEFYEKESSKIMTEAKTYDLESSEKTRIYHHTLLKNRIKKSQISKLSTENGMITGQK